MRNRVIARASVAGLVAGTVSVSAWAQAPANESAPPQAAESISIVGCVVRAADHARATGAPAAAAESYSPTQLVLTGTEAYSITGRRETELGRYVGRRLEITGTIERARVAASPGRGDGAEAVGSAGRVSGGLPPAGATGVTPGGSPAHEQGDALPGTIPPTQGGGDAAGPAGKAPGDLTRINVTAFRAVEGVCDDTRAPEPPRAASAPAPKEPPAAGSRPAATTPERPVEQPMTMVGCLVRQTRAGGALTPQAEDAGDELVLTRAVQMEGRSATPASAVPGSAPSGTGSGTVPPAAAARNTPGTVQERSLTVAVRGDVRAALSKHIGQRVELVGTVSDEAADEGAGARGEKTAPAAHPSAPAQRITVTSFRAVGGSCN